MTKSSTTRSVGADCGTENAASGFRRDDSRMQTARKAVELCTYASLRLGFLG